MSVAPRAGEQRKLVSVVFADVVGSTAFGSDNDPEAVRSVMASYFDRMRAIAEIHGGTVEKFIGDAVMVVFGIPLLHDDDAERAVRAGLAMRDAMADLNRDLGVSLAARIGVNTGEAVAGDGGERQFLVTGDAVNVAARLQQGADAGEVVVGALTESLTRAAIEYEPRAGVHAKGKTEPLEAFRALRARSAVPEQARGLPAMRAQLVGRQRELRLLLDTFERVRTERRAHLFTLVGNAGIGKSRLVGELLARVAASGGARVVRGRCLPYGQGITYWPLMEIVRDDAGIVGDDGHDAALAKLARRVAEIGGPDGVEPRLAVMLNLRDAGAALPAVRAADVGREIGWAVREYLAAIARDPLVVVVDDLQWAEPAVFEIVEALAERAEDAPLLLLCVARPTLLETNPTWSAARANSATITLDALSPDETTTLIARLLDVDDLPPALRARIVERSEGNPLFCEEFLRMLIDEGRVVREGDRWRAGPGAADVRVPESIHALLAARIDTLGADERRLLQIASVVGERFGEADVRALASDLDTAHAIAGLRRAGLVLEDRESRQPGRYRFKHLLMRDVAYAGLAKAARADLHEAFLREQERSLGDRREEFAEILAYHAERAFTLATEVRAPRAVIEPRARAVLERALALGERARRRHDAALIRPHARAAAAAVAALGETAPAEQRVQVRLLEADAFRLAGEYTEATALFDEAARLAHELGSPLLEARALLGSSQIWVWTATNADSLEGITQRVTEAERLFQSAGDTAGKIEVGLVALEYYWGNGDLKELLRRGAELLELARRTGDVVSELFVCARLYPTSFLYGRYDLADAYAARSRELVAQLGVNPPWLRNTVAGRARLEGDLAAALASNAEREADAQRSGDQQELLGALRLQAEIELFDRKDHRAGGPVAARALELSVRIADSWNRAELLGMCAIVAAAEGDAARAARLLDEGAAHASRGDVYAIAFVRHCRATVHDLAGRSADAETDYTAAERLMDDTDYGRGAAGAMLRLPHAELLVAQGRGAEAAALLAEVEGRLPAQRGGRAERIARLREGIARVASARG